MFAALVFMAMNPALWAVTTVLAWDEYMLEATLLAVSMVLGFLFELWRARREDAREARASAAEQGRSERERSLEDERHSRLRTELDDMRTEVAELRTFRALAEHRIAVLEEDGGDDDAE